MVLFIELFKPLTFGGCGGGPRFVLKFASVAFKCVPLLFIFGCWVCCCCCCFWRFSVKRLLSSALKSMDSLLAWMMAGGLLLRASFVVCLVAVVVDVAAAVYDSFVICFVSLLLMVRGRASNYLCNAYSIEKPRTDTLTYVKMG